MMQVASAQSAGDVVLALSLCSSILYGIKIRAEPSAPRTALKAGATALLAAFAVLRTSHWQLAPALALGSLGDAFLAWPGNQAFLCGLSSFLVAHLFYISLFARIGSGADVVLSSKSRLSLAGCVTVSAPFLGFLLIAAVAAPLKIPIAAYSTVILAMFLAVLTVDNNHVVLGATLFAISDSVLAVDEFLVSKNYKHRPLMQYVVWILYYAGQTSIATALQTGAEGLKQ
ncbi:YhhN-like protein [Moelleriella libera RCEF 2490]|uniref:YhhN-like protein n=1 Tax=Moelleriella libera RCEF 2490 TaxID=1081109 RepID=A0A167XLU7_9HYPO|nr:YhhN-like protein [Moelleriella libera RCEF 2490]